MVLKYKYTNLKSIGLYNAIKIEPKIQHNNDVLYQNGSGWYQ